MPVRPFCPAASARAALVSLCLFGPLAVSASLHAQAPPPGTATGRLRVKVTDPLRGLLPGATVTVSGPQPGGPAISLVTDSTGQAAAGDLVAGRYQVLVELSGFAPASDAVVVAAGGVTRHEMVLELATFAEEVTVRVDETDRRLDDNFTETMSAEDIAQLPDDPDEALALIQQLAGPDAEIRVNGFEGTELPPKAQIQAIRVRQDPFAPDAHGAGRARIEIITKPGTSGWEHHLNAGLRDQALDARNPFAPTRGEGQTRRLRWSSSGPLVRNRTSLSFNLSMRDAFDAQAIVAVRPDGTVNDTVDQHNGRVEAEVRLEHALAATHTLRVEYQRRAGERDNLGVGEFSLPEHAYDTSDNRHVVRLSDIGTFGKSAFNEFRVEMDWRADDRRSRSDAVTVNVANAFTSGGAQLAGGTREFELEVGDDFEIAVGERHKVRLGFEGEFGRHRSDQTSNANGRFTFPSLEAFVARAPIQFVQRVGEPSLAYSRYEASWYLYDEYRPRKGLQLGLGLRHEFQSFTDDWANFGPRASVAWTPAALSGTTFRAGAGVFYDWYDASLHEETLRLDGTRQRDLIVTDPGWPDPFAGTGGVEVPAPSIVRAGQDVQLPTTRRLSIGVEQPLGEGVSVRFNVFDETTSNRLRSLDVNAPVDGVRPNAALARVTEMRSIGRAEERGLDVSLRARSRERGFFGTLRYRYERELNDADGALSLPADSANLAAEWGPASDDVRHRLFGYVRFRLPYGISTALSARVASGAPYTVRTGFDDNADAVLNDRPLGVGRNTERGEWHALADLRLGWRVGGHAGTRRSREGRGQEAQRGVEVYGQVTNLLNTTNFVRYSGVLTSPYFGEPTAALPGRRMELGLRLSF